MTDQPDTAPTISAADLLGHALSHLDTPDILTLVAAIEASNGTAGVPVTSTVLGTRLGKKPGTIRASLKRLADADLLDRSADLTESGNAVVIYRTKYDVR